MEMQILSLLSFPFIIVEIHPTNIERLLLPRTLEMWKQSIVWPSKNIFSYDSYSSVEHKGRCLADCSCCSFPYNSYRWRPKTVKIQKGQKSDLYTILQGLLKSYDHSPWENDRNVFYLLKLFFHHTSVYSKLLHHNRSYFIVNVTIYRKFYIYSFKKYFTFRFLFNFNVYFLTWHCIKYKTKIYFMIENWLKDWILLDSKKVSLSHC